MSLWSVEPGSASATARHGTTWPLTRLAFTDRNIARLLFTSQLL
jgi:hypothetical protein